ncbi:CinY protein [Streptomyces angustmyceticus]|uniref:CinY protein n=1 Tax=Streptomyces angustmyceticus TaxID=285578 RepID=UPI0034504F1A
MTAVPHPHPALRPLFCLLAAALTATAPGSGGPAWAAESPSSHATPATSSYGFGTVNGPGQHAEHERITRAALACTPGRAGNQCFQPASLDQLAGTRGTFGAVGSPDIDEIPDAGAHCDDADFLAAPGYPQSRAAASAALRNCVTHLKADFSRGVARAAGMAPGGEVDVRDVNLEPGCTFALGIPGRAKCEALEGLGRALHGTQDFYSHSNWTDHADPRRATGTANPPGLGRTTPAPFLRLADPAAISTVPTALTTGCFTLLPGGCAGRVTHDTLNKDTGIIDAVSGAATGPTTSRGKVAGNFAAAVAVAVENTRVQWRGLRDALAATYGPAQGARLACALSHDNPVRDC